MAKYHLTPDGPKLCRAVKRACPLGDNPHFTELGEAQHAYEEGQSVIMPVKKARVYRNGDLTPSIHKGEVLAYSEKADAVKPDDDRAGRLGSLYASPSVEGVSRWVRGNLSMGKHDRDFETYEISLNANTVYVYSIQAWEEFSWHGGEPEDYWESGVLLRDYLADPEKYNKDDEWEILFKKEDILSKRRVTKQRILNSIQDEFWRAQTELHLRRSGVK